jgi:hypothetical protein
MIADVGDIYARDRKFLRAMFMFIEGEETEDFVRFLP